MGCARCSRSVLEQPQLAMPWGKRQQVVVGTDWRAAHKVLAKKFNLLFDEEKEDLGDLPNECARIFTSYLARYKTLDRKWKVVGTEIDETDRPCYGLIFQVIIELDRRGAGRRAVDSGSQDRR